MVPGSDLTVMAIRVGKFSYGNLIIREIVVNPVLTISALKKTFFSTLINNFNSKYIDLSLTFINTYYAHITLIIILFRFKKIN